MKCADCGIERPSLHTHHIIPRSQGGTGEPSNLVVLCANCHEDRHGGSFGKYVNGLSLSHTPEAEKKKSETMRKLWSDPQYKAKIIPLLNAGLARMTPEQRAAKSRKLSAAFTPESKKYHAQMSHTPEAKVKRSKAMVRLWADPEYKARQIATRKRTYSNQTREQRQSRMAEARRARLRNSKLTEETVKQLHILHSQGQTQSSLAKQFGVSTSNVSQVVHRKRWTHVIS